MKRYEYMTVDLSAEPSFNVHVKLTYCAISNKTFKNL